MNRQMKKVAGQVRQWTKSFGLPALVMAVWLAAVALLATEMVSPVPLQAAIEEVLATPATQTTPVPSPTASQPVVVASRGDRR